MEAKEVKDALESIAQSFADLLRDFIDSLKETELFQFATALMLAKTLYQTEATDLYRACGTATRVGGGDIVVQTAQKSRYRVPHGLQRRLWGDGA